MDEDGSSWLRPRFSRSIYQTYDSSPKPEVGRVSGLKSRPRSASFAQFDFTFHGQKISRQIATSFNQQELPFQNQEISVPNTTQVHSNPITIKYRCLSPLPESVFPDTFKEAMVSKKRFSTPPRDFCKEQEILDVLFFKDDLFLKSSKSLMCRGNEQVSCARVDEKPKHRCLSPLPTSVLSDAFKEARIEKKRFSTPPRKSCKDKGLMSRVFSKENNESKSPRFSLRTFSEQARGIKVSWKPKNKKDASWSKYFDHNGGKVNAVETNYEMSLDLSKLYLGLRFAHGAHSKIYHGMYDEKPVAVKVIKATDDDSNEALAVRLEHEFTAEVTFLSRLKHPNVLQLVAARREEDTYCIVTEYLSEGSLRSYLHKREHKPVPLDNLVTMALDIARGMAYVHSQGIIHRDLKPENVLFDHQFSLKVADFGTACKEANCNMLSDEPGTYRWMAPEMIKRKSYGRKVDVYSFGLILWEMVSGRIPFDYMNPVQAAFAVANKNLRPSMPASCPPAMKVLIEQCWSLQPDKRPDFWQIVKVLEMFKSSADNDGTLNMVDYPIIQDNKKGLLRWIQKLGPVNSMSKSQLY